MNQENVEERKHVTFPETQDEDVEFGDLGERIIFDRLNEGVQFPLGAGTGTVGRDLLFRSPTAATNKIKCSATPPCTRMGGGDSELEEPRRRGATGE